MANVDPFIIEWPRVWVEDQEIGPVIHYLNIFLHDLWQRTGGGDDAIGEASDTVPAVTFGLISELTQRLNNLETLPFQQNAQLSELKQQIDNLSIPFIRTSTALKTRLDELESLPTIVRQSNPSTFQIETTASYTTSGAYDREIVRCTNSGSITVTLQPIADGAGKIVTVIRAGTGAVTIDGNGAETITGETTQSLISQYDAADLVATTAEWVLS